MPRSKERVRSLWNVLLAVMICYCGIAVPLEIAFEADMIVAMCPNRAAADAGSSSSSDASTSSLSSLAFECGGFLTWFCINLVVDVFFVVDVLVNLRTGYIVQVQNEQPPLCLPSVPGEGSAIFMTASSV